MLLYNFPLLKLQHANLALVEAVCSSYFTIGWLDSLQGGLHQGELFGFCNKSYVLT